MLPVHTFQQYRAFALRQETGIHRLIHDLAVGIDVGCEGRVAKSESHHADFGEMYRHAVGPMPDLPFKGYGKLSSWNRITERADAKLITARGSHVRASDDSVRIDDEHSRRLPVRHAHHSVDLDGWPQFGGQRVIALNGIPAAAVAERSSIFDEHHHAGADDREALRVVQGYGKLFRHPTAVRRGVGGFRVAKHLHLPVTLDKQAETAGRERDDAHVG